MQDPKPADPAPDPHVRRCPSCGTGLDQTGTGGDELLECPPLPAANYILVRREAGARRKVLSIGRVGHTAPSLNLAEIRQRGAELSADEVHVHLLAETPKLSKLVEFDLRTGQIEADLARLTGSSFH